MITTESKPAPAEAQINEALKVTPAQQMMSSCAGALLVSLFMTPLDVVKIRLQAQDMVFSRKCFLYSNGITDHLYARVNGDAPPPTALHTREEICNCRWYNRPKYFTGTLDALVKIGKVEGVSSLWSGLSPTLISAVPTTVIYFTTYERIKLAFLAHAPALDPETTVPLSSGAIARVFAVTVVSPLELIRTKMQSRRMALWQIREAIVSTVRSEGPRGLWKGYGATLYRDVPFSALYWPFYEYIRGHLISRDQAFGAAFISGALAGSTASALTLPMDVIKTRHQLEMGEHELTGKAQKKKTSLGTAREIVSQQGVRGLFTGLAPRVLKVAPACAIMISSYEYCKRFFAHHNELKAQ
ncbi:hypothetical protein TCAL_02401 [Tigriopus californicus]|uniref:Solute carrier family 25 member 40 n=1 Tax=Tigriopus californicus TaxID=6832 RepID=A0A553P059_TIGCA|nr:probable mitochondrial glutathione transporter SLC25A40 [Tigriopus californicus]XP_059091576.1 probable mitochondrial glutathione transporter SLC25A40 [Tigriopus californicus]XP_059091578.1 probable mitochondrial glutathione transporter SLC25A40 [Tigriopus californicus]TRY71057.1 hypothetical protein TCAL_02401 [Tigriopus californicus]|eukprot:TCALIF_02401-PA protein Name:"Similar to slc25a40 Solute carrier family 25 member 40 (Danio rerio)" AED:0.02 eAED:0.02 QI:462/1/1/1/0.5/0.33/3/111/355